MTNVTIKFTIKSLLNIQTFNEKFPFETEIERTIITNCDSLLKDVCNDTLKSIGLGHLSHLAKVSIKTSDSKYFTFDSFAPALNLSIGILKPIFGNTLIIKILISGKAEDFSHYELEKTLYCNLFQLVINKYSFIKDYITDITLKDILDNMKKDSYTYASYESLLKMNNLVKNELMLLTRNEKESVKTEFSVNDTIKEIQDVSTLGESNDYNNIESNTTSESIMSIIDPEAYRNEEEQLFVNTSINENVFKINESLLEILHNTSPPRIVPENLLVEKSPIQYRSRITFDQNNETPVLEKWFAVTKKPSPLQLQQIADYLNSTSKRPEDVRITSQNVKIWFKNRRAKGKRRAI